MIKVFNRDMDLNQNFHDQLNLATSRSIATLKRSNLRISQRTYPKAEMELQVQCHSTNFLTLILILETRI